MQKSLSFRLIVSSLILCLSACAVPSTASASVFTGGVSESSTPVSSSSGTSSTSATSSNSSSDASESSAPGSSSSSTGHSGTNSTSATSSSSSSESEIIFTYTDSATSKTLEITAEDLFGTGSPQSIDTDFNDVFEAFVRKCSEERFELKFETKETVEEMRDGKGIFSASEEYGVGSDGYLVEQMPYTISHILVKLASATNGEHTQATISEVESRKLGQVIELLAGADINTGEGRIPMTRRADFGTIAQQTSDDAGSAAKYGQLGVMDSDTADSFINEFKFGIYAFETIYNAVNQSEEANPYAAKARFHENSGETYRLNDNIRFSSNATYTDKSQNQTADEVAGGLLEGEHYISNYFKTAGSKIGRIPYGAAVALAKDEVARNDFEIDGQPGKKMDWQVNEGSTAFYPRNILFNKYFNNHKVAVIVPNEIPYNDPSIAELGTADDYTTENFEGAYSNDYAALPGFQTDTADALPNLGCNALTTEKGQIVLAVRGGVSGSYEGIHFMVIDRSALNEYVELDTAGVPTIRDLAYYEANKDTKNVTSLSDYYTIHAPGETAFPHYITEEGTEINKITYINQLHATYTDYKDNVRTLTLKIKDYNPNKNTYFFQRLIQEKKLVFADSANAKLIEKLIQDNVKARRAETKSERRDRFDNSWTTYIEYLIAQDAARSLCPDGSQRLISETCAIGYNKKASDPNAPSALWSAGGACSLR